MATLAEIVTTYASGVPYPADAHNNEMMYIVQGLAGVSAGQMPYMAGLRDPALTAAPTSDGQVPTWDSATSTVVWKSQAGGDGNGHQVLDTSRTWGQTTAGSKGELVAIAYVADESYGSVGSDSLAGDWFPPVGMLNADVSYEDACSVMIRGLIEIVYTATNPNVGDRLYAVKTDGTVGAYWQLTTTKPTAANTVYCDLGYTFEIVNQASNIYKFYVDFSVDELTVVSVPTGLDVASSTLSLSGVNSQSTWSSGSLTVADDDLFEFQIQHASSGQYNTMSAFIVSGRTLKATSNANPGYLLKNFDAAGSTDIELYLSSSTIYVRKSNDTTSVDVVIRKIGLN